MNSWKSFFLFVLGAALIAGCGPKKPDGIPNLYPAKVTVTNAGKPVSDAKIYFILQKATGGSWSIIGTTDAKGVANVTTFQGEWKSSGVPEGEYKVYITKAPDFKFEEPPAEIANDSDALDAFSREQMKKAEAMPKEIPEVLSSPTKTPLTLKVTAGTPAELTVDLSEHK